MARTLLSLRGVLLAAALGCLPACGNDSHSAGQGGELDHGKLPIGDACLTPNAGCPCTKEAMTAECGETIARSGDTITCSQGTRSCAGGVWGECAGKSTVKILAPKPQAPGVQTQGLAPSSVSCLEACDPYCQELADTPDDLVVPPDLTSDGTGLTLYAMGFTGSNCPDVGITPANASITITTINADGSVMPNSVLLKADCGAAATEIVPSWSTDQPDRSSVEVDGTLQVFSGIAGVINVTASTLLDTSMSPVTVKVNVNEGLTDTSFDGAGTTADPGKTLYPYKDTVFPLDLKAPLVQWKTGGAAAGRVQVALRYPVGVAMPTFWYSKILGTEPNDGTIQTTGAPSWQIPQAVWTAFSRTAAGANAEIIIQRKTGAGTVYQEMKIPVRFSTAALRGTVYYTQYLKRVFKPGVADLCSGQADLPTAYSPVAPMGEICPVGNCTHADDVFGGSTTRAIDMSNPAAANLDPFNGAGGCPVCHSVSASGNTYVAGSRFLQTWGAPAGTSAGFVNKIGVSPGGVAQFTVVGEAANYSSMPTATDWNSRGFAYAPLTPDGKLALQGFYSWGNTQDGTVGNNTTTDRSFTQGGQVVPMFFVPTAKTGATVQFATTLALAATRTGNVLTSNAGGLPTIDGATLAPNDSLLVKDQALSVDNGIYTVTSVGTAASATADLTSSTTLPMTASSSIQPASNAIDNSTGSRWESAYSDPQWLTVDLGGNRTVTRVSINWENASAQSYTVEISVDGLTWMNLVTKTAMPGGPRIDNLTGLNGTGRYVRMTGLTRTTIYGYSIWEMEVFGDDPGSPYKLTRRSDAQTPATADGTIKSKWEVRVTRGTANYSRVFRLSAPTTDPVINTDGMTFTDVGADALPVMMTPTISPDGTKVAYVTGNTDVIGADSAAWRKGLSMLSFTQATRKISAKKRLLNNWDGATGGAPIKWPFFEHDSRSLLYVQSTSDNFCSTENASTDVGRACKESVYGNSAPTARGYWKGSLFSLDTAAGTPAATASELSKLDDAEDAADADKAYQPTVLPFASGGYRWVIFTSPRSYGNQFNQIGTNFTCGATMLWISALDDVIANGTDRSHPAFFLPGQNVVPITTPEHYVNERGYLVPSPCKTSGLSCSTSDECCGGTQCRVDSIADSGVPNKVCKDPAACSAVGGACLTSADCCGGSPCTAQKCENVPSYAASATFTRDYVATCPFGFQPRWGLFSLHVTTRSDSRVGLKAYTAATSTDLATAVAVDLGDSTADNYGGMADSRDVGDALEAAPQSFSLAYLRIAMTLYPSTNGALAPIVHDWEQRYTCEPAE